MQYLSTKHKIQPQVGLSLIELMVALALGSLIVLAAVAALTVSRQGFNTVDTSAQLRDDGRFASSLIRRLALQAGFLDFDYASNIAATEFKVKSATAMEVEPPIKGFNNAAYKENLATGSSNSVSTPGLNNSDLLIIRFQPGSIQTASGASGDMTMINCDGSAADYPPVSATDRMINAFHIANSKNEPSLMCTFQTKDGTWDTQPIVQGVESMQLLFGVDGVIPGSAPSASTTPDSIPDRYLRADQLIVSGDDAATNLNWKRVRSIRIGLVLRGAPGSAQGDIPAQYPLGAKGLMNGNSDSGSTFPAKTDGRLRQTVTFTIHLRNRQDLM